MSPEICAAEAYGWASDIWALGCVVYELCAKEPPFNARTHLELIQKIRMGRVKPLPSFYSKELQDVVMQCIRVNQQTRPDTASLLNLPMVKLKRKEMEMVDLGRKMQARIEQANQKTKEAEQSIAREKDTLRREWEVKARLEIDRQVEKTRLRLEGEFKAKVEAMVHQEVTKIKKELESRPASRQEELRPSSDMYVRSSTPDLADLPEETILDELSLNSPTATRTKPPQKKTSRTPFTRARTMIDNSPIDVDMRDSTPSAPSIANLGLSPRQTRPQSSASSRSRKNIFTTTSQSSDKGSPSTSTSAATEESEDEGDSLALPPLAQPKDPFQNAVRPGLKRQATAPTKQGRPLSSIFKRPVSPTKSKENIDPNPLSRPSKLPARMPASPTKDLQGRSLVELSSATTWDPERDEMPSPFLSKMGRQPLLKGYRGGPGLSHLR